MKDSEKEFTRIVTENKSTIYTVCYLFSNDSQEVEDLFQDVIIALGRGFGSFRGESNIRSWIYRVALNTCISADRKKRRHQESVHLNINIDLFADTDDDSRQSTGADAPQPHKSPRGIRPRYNPTVAREPLLRRDWRHCRHLGQECLGALGTHPRTAQSYV